MYHPMPGAGQRAGLRPTFSLQRGAGDSLTEGNPRYATTSSPSLTRVLFTVVRAAVFLPVD